MGNTLSIDRSNIADPIVKQRRTDKPETLLADIESAINLGLDWQVECIYIDGHKVGETIIPARRYELTIWAKVDTAEMREALANLALQRARRAHPAGANFDRPEPDAEPKIDHGRMLAAVAEMGDPSVALDLDRAPRVRP